MAELIALMGAPGSGKSTLAGQIAPSMGAEVVQIDNIWSRPHAARGRIITAKMRKVESSLAAGRNVIFDSCLTHPGMRSRLLGVASRARAQTKLIYLSVPLAECQRRVANREREVPAYKIEDLHRKAESAWIAAQREAWGSFEGVVRMKASTDGEGMPTEADWLEGRTEESSAACIHWYVMVQGGMRCKKCGAKL